MRAAVARAAERAAGGKGAVVTVEVTAVAVRAVVVTAVETVEAATVVVKVVAARAEVMEAEETILGSETRVSASMLALRVAAILPTVFLLSNDGLVIPKLPNGAS